MRLGRHAPSEEDLALAEQISETARELGVRADLAGLEVIQVAIDALVIPDVLPFWRAVLGYDQVDDADLEDPPEAQRAPRPKRRPCCLSTSPSLSSTILRNLSERRWSRVTGTPYRTHGRRGSPQTAKPYAASTCTNAVESFCPFRPVRAGGTGEKSWSRSSAPRLLLLSPPRSLPDQLLSAVRGQWVARLRTMTAVVQDRPNRGAGVGRMALGDRCCFIPRASLHSTLTPGPDVGSRIRHWSSDLEVGHEWIDSRRGHGRAPRRG